MNKIKNLLPSEILSDRPELKQSQIGYIKAIIGSLPIIGTITNELLFDIPNRIHQARINDLVELLTKKLNNINKQKISFDYLQTEDFYDFSRVLFENSVKIKSEEKRRLLANIYIDSIINKSNFETSKNKIYLNYISELSLIQIIILKFIYKNQKKLIEIGSYSKLFVLFKNSNTSYDLDNYEFKSYCNDLEFKGLISLGAGLEDYKSKSSIRVSEAHKEASAVITNFGKTFIDFLLL